MKAGTRGQVAVLTLVRPPMEQPPVFLVMSFGEYCPGPGSAVTSLPFGRAPMLKAGELDLPLVVSLASTLPGPGVTLFGITSTGGGETV